MGAFYKAKGELQKALSVYLDVVDKLPKNGGYGGNAALDAARLFNKLGDENGAALFYAKIPAYGNGWLTGLALHDQAQVAMNRRDYEKAELLLQKNVIGAGAERIGVVLQNDAAIKGSTEALTRAMMAKDLSPVAVQAFLEAQSDPSKPNPLAAVSLPLKADEIANSLKNVSGKLREETKARMRINLLLADGSHREAMVIARQVLINNVGSAAGAEEVCRVFKAMDLSLKRGNEFIAYLKTGTGPNPVTEIISRALEKFRRFRLWQGLCLLKVMYRRLGGNAMRIESEFRRFTEEHEWARGRERDIQRWLLNFAPDHRALALQLLHGVRVYTNNDLREGCSALHGRLQREFIGDSEVTRYLGLGSLSESGLLVACHYRQVNGIPVDHFISFEQATDTNILAKIRERHGAPRMLLIALDDFIGSGNQAAEQLRTISTQLESCAGSVRCVYSALMGYREGINNIQAKSKFSVIVTEVLKESDKVFGDGSTVFPEFARANAKEIFEKYGKQICPNHPLGYRDGQALVVFDHNCPNNTLPVLWSSSKGWHPLFPRYEKVRSPRNENALAELAA